MLILGNRLVNTPVMSLQTGVKLANTFNPIIDPATLKIYAFEIVGPLLSQNPSYLLTSDIREFGHLGMIVDSNDEIVTKGEVIKLDEILSLNFSLVGLRVIDENKRKLGKVDTFTLNSTSFVIEQLSVRHGILRGISDTGLLIHRSQIIEINDNEIIVKASSIKSAEPVMQSIRSEFVNPFRATADTSDTN